MKRDIKVRNGTVAVVALAAVGVAVLLFSRSAAVEAAYPVERARRGLATRVWSRAKGAWRGAEAAAENVRLKREVASLAMARGEAEAYAKEVLRLRRLLGYAEALPGRWLAAPVLSAGGGAAAVRQTIRVGKGSLAGVRTGAVAAVPDGLVGKVTAVSPHTAEVLLITDPSLKVSCVVEGARGAKGILSGGTDDLLVMRHFTVGAEPPPRSRVLTSGLGGVFPAGLAVGTLLGVSRDAGGLVREGEVQPVVDFANLEDVFLKVEEGAPREG